jgi:uncharacterized protein YggE
MPTSHHFFDFDSSAERKGIIALTLLVLFFLVIFLFAETVKVVKESEYIGYDTSSSNSITVSGTGTVKAAPDTATFSFSVQADGGTQAAAQAGMTGNANAVIQFLKDSGVASSDIQTSDYGISQKYETEDTDVSSCPPNAPCPIQNVGNQVAVGFTASESVNVTLRNLSNSGVILSGVADKGATNVSGLSFAINDDSALKDKARSEAIADAKSEAEKLAGELGVHLLRVQSFSEDNGDSPAPLFRAAAAENSTAGPVTTPDIQTGQNSIVSNVTITYQIR